jgi:hypothetical protein
VIDCSIPQYTRPTLVNQLKIMNDKDRLSSELDAIGPQFGM